MSEPLPSLDELITFGVKNLAGLRDSMNLCFDSEYQLKPGKPEPWPEDVSGTKINGKPGLCVVFKPIDDRGYLMAIPEEMPLPRWYREPDESQQSRLQTLGMEWSYGILPEGFQDGGYSTMVSNDLVTAVTWSGINEQTELVEFSLVDQKGKSASNASLWLVGPLDTLTLGDEEPTEEEEFQGAEIEEPSEGVSLSSQEVDSQNTIERIRRIMPMSVDVSVRLAEKKIGLSQLQSLGPGMLITFPKSCDDLLDLYINNKLYAQGEAVKIGEKFGLKVNEIGVQKERPPGVFSL